MARKIAEEGDGIYVSGAASTVVNDVDEQLKTLATSSLEKINYTASAEQFPVFAWIALAFLILDIFMLDRKVGWLKKSTSLANKNNADDESNSIPIAPACRIDIGLYRLCRR